MAFSRSNGRTGQQGIALLVVLMFTLLLSAIVIDFAYEAQVQASLTSNRRDEFQAYIAAKSVIAQGMALLESDLMTATTGTNSNNNNAAALQTAIQNYKNGKKTTTSAAQNSQETIPSDSMQDPWGQGIPYQPVNDASAQCTIGDESGKLNLNALFITGQDGQQQENPIMVNALRALFAAMGVEDDPTDAILDWLDTDNDARTEGSESDEYQSLESPYSCKNGPMDSIEELLLINGITPDLYFNCNRTTTGYESVVDPLYPNQLSVGLSDLLTVHGDTYGRINVNTARAEVLEAFITSVNGGNADSVEKILEMRMAAPFETVADFHSDTGCPVIPLNMQSNGVAATTTTTGTSKGTSGNTSASSSNTPKSFEEPKASTTTASTTAANTTAANGTSAATAAAAAAANSRTRGASGDIFNVASNVFRICGDGMCNGVMVRIEAFVYRTPTEVRGTQTNYTDRTGVLFGKDKSKKTATNGGPPEAFHILDWRVIR